MAFIRVLGFGDSLEARNFSVFSVHATSQTTSSVFPIQKKGKVSSLDDMNACARMLEWVCTAHTINNECPYILHKHETTFTFSC
jgi:hypothetical protein